MIANTWFPGSAWEPTELQALPAVSSKPSVMRREEPLMMREAETLRQCVPRQSLGTSVAFANAFAAAKFCILLLLASSTISAQTATEPLIAKSSNLSQALSPGEWSRVESSVDKGLTWLASQQAEDGRFPSDEVAQPAVTALAVMAFLSRGHIPDQGRYGQQLSKGNRFRVVNSETPRIFFTFAGNATRNSFNPRPNGYLQPFYCRADVGRGLRDDLR